MKKLFLTVALLSISAIAHSVNLGAWGAAMEGQQDYERKEKLDQCIKTCRPGDGQCYQGCAAAYGPPPKQQQQYTPPPQEEEVKRTDYACFNQCLKAGYAYGLCKSKCSY